MSKNVVFKIPTAREVLRAVDVAAKEKGRPAFVDDLELGRSYSPAKRQLLEQLAARGLLSVTVYRYVQFERQVSDEEALSILPMEPGVFFDWRSPKRRRYYGDKAMFSLTRKGAAVMKTRSDPLALKRLEARDAIRVAQSRVIARSICLDPLFRPSAHKAGQATDKPATQTD